MGLAEPGPLGVEVPSLAPTCDRQFESLKSVHQGTCVELPEAGRLAVVEMVPLGQSHRHTLVRQSPVSFTLSTRPRQTRLAPAVWLAGNSDSASDGIRNAQHIERLKVCLLL